MLGARLKIFRKTRFSARKIHTSIPIALASLFGALVISTASANSPANSETRLPAALKPCIPSDQAAKVKPIDKVRLSGIEYYLLSAYELNDTQGTDLVISLQGDRCKQVFYNPMGDPIPLANAVGKQVARQLTLGRYRRKIKEIGRDKFQQEINESAANSKQVFWWDEEVWALRQLRLKVPKNVVVK